MRSTFILLVFAACTITHEDHDPAIQPVTCGTVTCEAPPPPVCVGNSVRTTTAGCADGACSTTSSDAACGALGCCEDHCCEASVSNGSDFGGLEPTGLVIAAPTGTFDTNSQCLSSSVLGACTVVQNGANGEACVCRSDELAISTLRITGSRALVLLALRSVDIGTLLDVSANHVVAGPGASTAVLSTGAGASGGAGGSYGGQGGAGGGAASPPNSYGTASLIPLVGGMAGQSSGSPGGAGGGAVQITAGVRISVPGVINAGGGGGNGGVSSWSISGGGGGGAGGGVLLEAPLVVVSGTIVANGGGGGGGGGDTGNGGFGNNGNTAVAYGGGGHDGSGCPLYGYVSGGHGGYGAVASHGAYSGVSSDYDSRCLGSASFVGGGGGGGGVGRIRINTASGCQCSGVLSPAPSIGPFLVQ